MVNAVKRSNMEQLAQYREHLRKHPRLIYLFFELTDACNLSCLHCGSSACPQNHTYLPMDAVKKVIDEVAAAYSPPGMMICLSGGEPLLHPDFFEILTHIKHAGFSCGITTNGTLIQPQVARKLVQGGLDSVSFSLDGLKDTHDWFRNKPGAFELTTQGIRNLVEAAGNTILTQVTTVVHRKNIHQLDAMYDLVCQLGVRSWRIINLEPIGRALQHPDLLLNRQELQTMLSFIREKRYAPQVSLHVTYGCSHYLGEDLERTVRDYYFSCASGLTVASVLCNGDIYSCMDIERRPELVQGNIVHDSFIDVWENRFQSFRADRTSENETCLHCADRNYCQGDSAHTWSYDEKRPLLCMKQLFG